jgi:hypothetical protein
LHLKNSFFATRVTKNVTKYTNGRGELVQSGTVLLTVLLRERSFAADVQRTEPAACHPPAGFFIATDLSA